MRGSVLRCAHPVLEDDDSFADDGAEAGRSSHGSRARTGPTTVSPERKRRWVRLIPGQRESAPPRSGSAVRLGGGTGPRGCTDDGHRRRPRRRSAASVWTGLESLVIAAKSAMSASVIVRAGERTASKPTGATGVYDARVSAGSARRQHLAENVLVRALALPDDRCDRARSHLDGEACLRTDGL